MLSIFNIKKPPGVIIGEDKSPMLSPESLLCILAFKEFSSIQPTLPPSLALSDRLYVIAAFSNPSMFILVIIFL